VAAVVVATGAAAAAAEVAEVAEAAGVATAGVAAAEVMAVAEAAVTDPSPQVLDSKRTGERTAVHVGLAHSEGLFRRCFRGGVVYWRAARLHCRSFPIPVRKNLG
jgi:hypothetical protein